MRKRARWLRPFTIVVDKKEAGPEAHSTSYAKDPKTGKLVIREFVNGDEASLSFDADGRVSFRGYPISAKEGADFVVID